MKKQLYIFSFAIAMMTTVNAFQPLTMFDESQGWEILEKNFITDINQARQSFWAHVSGAAIGVAVVSGVGLTCVAKNAVDKDGNEIPFIGYFQKTKTVSGLATGAMAVLGATQAAQCWLSHKTNRNAVAKFFGNWDQNQFYTPVELQEAFDIIAETMELQGDEAVLKNADEIVDTIQFLVMRHFEKRYDKVLNIAAYDALANGKTAGEILKNAVEATAKISGSK